MFLSEESANYAANKALRKLGIKEATGWESIFSTEGNAIPFDEGYLEFDAGAEVPFDKIANGSKCKVVWDGVEYVCTVKRSAMEISIGDADGKDENIPFWISVLDEREITGIWFVAVWTDTSEPTHAFDLYLQTETITPIDPKYLPGVCLPVVELGAMDFDAFPITITDEKVVAALESTAKNGTPCIIKIDFGGMIMATVFGFVYESETVFGFSGVMQGATFQIMCDSGQWSVSIVGA